MYNKYQGGLFMYWEEYFAQLLDVIKLKSKDPSTKVGAIITDASNSIVSTGFNGFPRGVYDSEERYNNRELKYPMIVHAEMNAILLAARNGKSLIDTFIWVNKFPCCECAKAIIQSGIKRVYLIEKEPDLEFEKRWEESIKLAYLMFKESGVVINKYIWHEQDKRFWLNSNDYINIRRTSV
jgi:dCMP deaminase